MQAPLSDMVRRILADRKLARKLMMAIQSERRNPDDIEGRTIMVDGKPFRVARVTDVNINRS
jgi:hypothetical protein